MEIYLADGYEFHYVEKKHVLKAVRDLGINVYRASRVQVKMPEGDEDLDDRRKWIPMGVEFRTGIINITCKPTGQSFENFAWPFRLAFVCFQRFPAIRFGLARVLTLAHHELLCQERLPGGAV